MNYATGLYEPYAFKHKGFVNYLYVFIIVLCAFAFMSLGDSLSMPKWLGGSETKIDLSVKVTQLEKDLENAQRINEDLNRKLDLQKDLEVIEVKEDKKLKEETKVIEKKHEVAKAETKKKVEQIESRTDITEEEKDLAVLAELVDSMQLVHSQVTSVKQASETLKG